MGGGRRQASDTIDYSVGFTDMRAFGRPGRRSASAGGYPRERRKQLAGSGESGETAIKLADKAPESTPTVYRRISE